MEKLPLPGPLHATEDELRGADGHSRTPHAKLLGDGLAGAPQLLRLAASYANFCLTADHLFAPLLDPERDDEALAHLARIFPHHVGDSWSRYRSRYPCSASPSGCGSRGNSRVMSATGRAASGRARGRCSRSW
ncbi:hypothetical protein [Streptomyces sp. NPDC042319]|uniref:hypothetical protein n=1 Tax=Streptomyces sp. NPDC042319 TaxID=3154332 RepID=UPI0033EF3717